MLCLFFPVLPTFASEYNLISLFSYSGYLTTPSAYITDGRLGFHYSYLPKYVAPFCKNRSENWIFSAALGFLPFMECYISVYVAPQVHISSEINYGAHKTRSAGMKIRIINLKNSSEFTPGLPHFLFAVRNSGGTECQEIGEIPRSLLRG